MMKYALIKDNLVKNIVKACNVGIIPAAQGYDSYISLEATPDVKIGDSYINSEFISNDIVTIIDPNAGPLNNV